MGRDKPKPTSKLQAREQLDFRKHSEWLLWTSACTHTKTCTCIHTCTNTHRNAYMYTQDNGYYSPHHLNKIGQGGQNLLSLIRFKYLPIPWTKNNLYDLGFYFPTTLGRKYWATSFNCPPIFYIHGNTCVSYSTSIYKLTLQTMLIKYLNILII